MFGKQKIILGAVLFLSLFAISAQANRNAWFEVMIGIGKEFDGTRDGMDVNGMSVISGEHIRIFSENPAGPDENPIWQRSMEEGTDFVLESIEFDSPDAGVRTATITVRATEGSHLADRLNFKEVEDFPATIRPASVVISLTVPNITEGQTLNLEDLDITIEPLNPNIPAQSIPSVWRDLDWRRQNIEIRWAQANMDQHNLCPPGVVRDDCDPRFIPAWRKDAPRWRGEYRAQARLSASPTGMSNFSGNVSSGLAPFTIREAQQ
ncbi:MAG: hypothetical protein FWE23_04450 [Chitinivibrionia bacterium]|nr:hypothetical protein [Chitinivibrionia bacterium]